MSKLRECPFCGNVPHIREERAGGVIFTSICCPSIKCSACVDDFCSTAEAIRAWNTRADDKLMDDMATALEALHAEQNGAPLIRDAAKWEAVMKTVEDVLTRYRERRK